MTAMERVEGLYEVYECVRSFGEDLRAHLANGMVVCTPGFFAMGRGVSSKGRVEDIRDPWFVFPREVQDAWYIYVFAGQVNTCMSFIPGSMRWLAWERVGKSALHFIDFKKFSNKMRITDEFGNEMNKRLRFFGGAKAPKAPKPVKMPAMPTVAPVTPLPPPDPIPAAPTTSKLEVEEAAADQKKQAARRNGMRKTILAGESALDPAVASGKKTILG